MEWIILIGLKNGVDIMFILGKERERKKNYVVMGLGEFPIPGSLRTEELFKNKALAK